MTDLGLTAQEVLGYFISCSPRRDKKKSFLLSNWNQFYLGQKITNIPFKSEQFLIHATPAVYPTGKSYRQVSTNVCCLFHC